MKTAVLSLRVLRELFWFLSFCTALYLPNLLESQRPLLEDPHVLALFEQALATDAVRRGLLGNLLGHLLPVLLTYGVLVWSASRAAPPLRLRPAMARLLLLFSGWALVMALNQMLFPGSGHATALASISGAVVLLSSAAVVSAALLLALASVLRAIRPPLPLRALAVPPAVLVGLGALFAVGFGHAPTEAGASRAGAAPGRNVFLIGVDSLALQQLRAAGDRLPNLNGLLASAQVFERAYTPIGRTFPAWVSLLSGLPPAEHGALFNLRDVDRVDRAAMMTHGLRAAGYRTVFALDEQRFANIDHGFGFDVVIGPKPGVLDFVIQRVNDTPLSNLLLQTPLGGWLLPYSHLNVASHANYDARGFVEAVARAADAGVPVFAAVHLETAHFPFRTRHAAAHAADGAEPALRERHLAALTVVDRQVQRLMSDLARRGLLREALVILVSDHGEGLGEPQPAVDLAGNPIDLGSDGHGTSVISEHQNRIVLGAAAYRDGHPVSAAAIHEGLVSIADVRGIVEGYVRDGGLHAPSRDCMTVETGIRLEAARQYAGLDEGEVAREGASYYEVDHRGRMRLREDRLAALVESKDVGLRCADRITLWSALEVRHRAFSIDPGDGPARETAPLPEDIARIEAYRERLRATFRQSDGNASAHSAGAGALVAGRDPLVGGRGAAPGAAVNILDTEQRSAPGGG